MRGRRDRDLLRGMEAAGCITFEEHTLLLGIACSPNDTKCMLGQLVIEGGSGQVTDLGALVKEMPSYTTFLTVHPGPAPAPHSVPPILGYPDMAGPVPAIWGPPLHSQG